MQRSVCTTETISQNRERLMDEAKRKEIEARLYQMLSQIDQDKKDRSPSENETCGARVIRRRKGDPDLHIA